MNTNEHSMCLFSTVSLLLWKKKNFSLFFPGLFFVSSGTDEVRAKRETSLCNESVNGHFWSNLCLNCIFKWTWFVKTDIWSVIDRFRVRFPVAAALIFFFLFFSTRIAKVGKCAAFQLWTPTYFTSDNKSYEYISDSIWHDTRTTWCRSNKSSKWGPSFHQFGVFFIWRWLAQSISTTWVAWECSSSSQEFCSWE